MFFFCSVDGATAKEKKVKVPEQTWDTLQIGDIIWRDVTYTGAKVLSVENKEYGIE